MHGTPPAPAPRPAPAQRAGAGDGALRGYLLALVGREPSSSLLELRPLHPDGRAAQRAFLPVGDLDLVERRVRALAPRLNVYVGACPRFRPEGHAGAVARAWVLWADIDAEEGLERLARFAPLPGVVLRTGSAGHGLALWPLSEPLAPAHAQRANRRLALALGADMNATDAARILRPPGTLNHKRQPPREVRCTRLEPVSFRAGDVVGRLPDTDHYRRPARRPRPVWHDAPRPERVLEGLARTVAQARQGGRNAALYWALCRAFEHVADGELDEGRALDELSMAALETGLGGGEIRATIGSAQRTARRAA